ncbi:ABC transporter permease [Desulfoluna spongiiphila]|uniref:Peptide/nickel transport system permease protein n=1 Tax=Desulfoluna spongiiphila TaxID=419481 RepID=A0A1G5C5G2_9BACT|nr:ABC transporter permease [Desulfoluna spongiiphila]SCX97550.1 peptide/nickel transport system permease protein [Desulfoluna spongiiphila]VVS94123.1 abc transporter type 1 transmembrane domain meti-like [Desulfoluna spongiiphila]
MKQIMHTLKRMSPSALFGVTVIVLNLLVFLVGPALAPYGETEVVGDVWLPMGAGHLLGTDHIGRDMLTRLIYGARNTIGIALLITFIAFVSGTFLGLAAATLKGWVDQVLGRLVDIVMAFPPLIFALMVLSVMGTSVTVLVVVLSLLDSTRVFRLARAVAMDVEVMPYVEAARLRGEGLWWVMRREILPNTLPPLIAEFGMRFCFVFLFISALSFLGLGFQPPAADWGSMVRENAGAITFGIPAALWPASVIAVLTIGVNLVVDWFLNIQGKSTH